MNDKQVEARIRELCDIVERRVTDVAIFSSVGKVYLKGTLTEYMREGMGWKADVLIRWSKLPIDHLEMLAVSEFVPIDPKSPLQILAECDG